MVKHGWNKSVLTTFNFIANLPETVCDWSSKSINAALKNPEVNNFVNSFSKNTDKK